MRWTLHNADCHEIEWPRCDAVICDPPYEEQAHTKQRRVDKSGRHDVEALDFHPMTAEDWYLHSKLICEICNGWALIFCQLESLGLWKKCLETYGAKWIRSGIWDKDGSATPQISGDRPSQGAEGIAIAWCGKGRMVWNGGGREGIWRHRNVWMAERRSRQRVDPETKVLEPFDPSRHMLHPTQKPIALMEALLRDFTNPGDLIADPFAGSGTTGVAAIRLGRNFIGTEKHSTYYARAFDRLTRTLEQPGLFDAVRDTGKPGEFEIGGKRL